MAMGSRHQNANFVRYQDLNPQKNLKYQAPNILVILYMTNMLGAFIFGNEF